MINQITSYDEYVSAMSAEVEELLKQVNDGYRQDAELLAKRFTMESYKLLNATTEMDVARAKANLRHIKASLTHIGAMIGLDLTDRLIAITGVVLSIAIRAAIKAII